MNVSIGFLIQSKELAPGIADSLFRTLSQARSVAGSWVRPRRARSSRKFLPWIRPQVSLMLLATWFGASSHSHRSSSFCRILGFSGPRPGCAEPSACALVR